MLPLTVYALCAGANVMQQVAYSKISGISNRLGLFVLADMINMATLIAAAEMGWQNTISDCLETLKKLGETASRVGTTRRCNIHNS